MSKIWLYYVIVFEFMFKDTFAFAIFSVIILNFYKRSKFIVQMLLKRDY